MGILSTAIMPARTAMIIMGKPKAHDGGPEHYVMTMS